MQDLKRVLIVSTYCFENPTANGICARKLFDEFSKQCGIDTHLLGLSERDCFTSNNEHTLHCSINNCGSTKNGKIRAIKKIFFPEENKDMIETYLYKIAELDSAYSFDTIIAMFFPPEIVTAVSKYITKKPNIRFIIYELDSYTDGVIRRGKGFYGKLVNESKIRWTRRVYRKADQILIMNCHKDESAKLYSQFEDKIVYTDLPLLIDNTQKCNNKKEGVQFLYTGELNQSYRNPTILLDSLNGNIQQQNWSIHFFTKGDCEDMINSASKNDQRIVCHGYVDSETLFEYYQEADILMSIGNSVSNSMPSKVITYVSTGKPIIHFCLQKKDIVAEYLSKYPIALIIPFDMPVREISKEVNAFVGKNKEKRLSFERVCEIYPQNTPQYSVDAMIKK